MASVGTPHFSLVIVGTIPRAPSRIVLISNMSILEQLKDKTGTSRNSH